MKSVDRCIFEKVIKTTKSDQKLLNFLHRSILNRFLPIFTVVLWSDQRALGQLLANQEIID
jgi:hypothetical protein